jgi:hypothetical protein
MKTVTKHIKKLLNSSNLANLTINQTVHFAYSQNALQATTPPVIHSSSCEIEIL